MANETAIVLINPKTIHSDLERMKPEIGLHQATRCVHQGTEGKDKVICAISLALY